MSKRIYLLILIIVAISQINCNDSKDLLTSVMSTVRGSNWTLPSDCQNATFEEEDRELTNNIDEKNSLKVLSSIEKVFTGLFQKCHDVDVQVLKSDVDFAFKSGKLVVNGFKHMEKIKEITDKLIKDKDFSPFNLGKVLGELINLTVYSKETTTHTNALTFLEIKEIDYSFDAEAFLNGIMEGVSSVPIQQNQCRKNIMSSKPLIVDAVKALYVAIKNKKNIIQSLTKLSTLVTSLPDLNSNCKILELASQIGAFSTYLGIGKLFVKVSLSPIAAYDSLKEAYTGFDNLDEKAFGVGMGKFIKIALGYSTK
jgi:hypothetical protein